MKSARSFVLLALAWLFACVLCTPRAFADEGAPRPVAIVRGVEPGQVGTAAVRAPDKPGTVCPVCPVRCELHEAPHQRGPDDEGPVTASKLVDLNQADESALLDLPGIGPARARAILDYRASHGGFRSVSQLLQIKGIGRSLLKQLRPLVTLSGATG